MEQDRELLELAAKAAGMPECFEKPFGPENYAAPGEFENGWGMVLGPYQYWNPLVDDGDALRLAMKLGIEIHPDREAKEVVTAFCIRSPRLIGLNTSEEFGPDEMEAARRAIVRAAAEIGRLMKEQS